MRRLEGRVAAVTGAGSGIGRATAVLLAERGCRLALADVSEVGLAGTAELVAAAGAEATTRVVDVRDVNAVRSWHDQVVADHGRCEVLVNNAGVTSAGRFDAETLDDLHWIVDVNVWGVVHGCHTFLPTLRRADEAHIVNLASMVALVGLPQNAAYSLTKGAVRAFSEALRAELRTARVGVTTVLPGAIRTNITAGARGAEAERLARMGASRLAPLAMRRPEAVARRIVGAIERDRARVLVGPDARALDVATRLVPGRSGALGRAIDRIA